ncbi:hypothetical protein [Candidatus Xenohaliotis californiensis]|uniref:hypothetical protein n=1 Tax=Candidatus Xenohaliotis californiensis TaxID=84677 RepID=UPI0030C895BC
MAPDATDKPKASFIAFVNNPPSAAEFILDKDGFGADSSCLEESSGANLDSSDGTVFEDGFDTGVVTVDFSESSNDKDGFGADSSCLEESSGAYWCCYS